MVFNSRFGFGDMVYLKTDITQDPWMVTQVRFALGSTIYLLARGSENYCAYDIELTDERDVLKSL
ncbi:hypothetical protein [Sphingobacterium sp. LRF_L2]|uniref:hypothetical protein n=1 Tax=Sphingobacterium sp. LRF_L2 TaxID=3369421 RepID=UPI003F61BAFC